MGLLGNLLGKVVSTVVDSAVDGVKKSISPSGNDGGGIAPAGTGSASKKYDAEDGHCKGEGELRERIEAVVAAEWPGYELRRNVPSSEMSAEPRARKFYTYGIYHSGAPVAMIMFLEDNVAYRRREVRLAQRACEGQGVPYMNFMTYMANHRAYISKRFRENIKG